MDLSHYIGLPYAERGRTRAGLDCWGLVRLVYLETWGTLLPVYLEDDYAVADMARTSHLIDRHRQACWSPVAAGAERVGDVILLRVMGLPCHVGLVAGSGRMLHVMGEQGVTCERYESALWAKRVMGFYRHASQ